MVHERGFTKKIKLRKLKSIYIFDSGVLHFIKWVTNIKGPGRVIGDKSERFKDK